MRTLIANITIVIAILLAIANGEIIASFKKPELSTEKGTFEIYFDRMKAWSSAHKPIYPVVVSGNQGAGKSTLLNALSQALNIIGNVFETANGHDHCTVDVNMGHSSVEGITPVDQPGQQKDELQTGINLSSANVDFMLAQTVSPFANILLHICLDSIFISDLEMMALYSDERMHTGELSAQQQSGAQPHLIIVLRTSRPDEPGYLERTIPASSPLRKTFKSIHLVRMPVVSEEDQEWLTNANFHPEDIPKYWAAVQNLKDVILDLAQQVPDSARWTPAEIATVLETNLPKIREGAQLDIPTARPALMLNKVRPALPAATPGLVTQFKDHVRDPYHKNHSSLLQALTAARTTAEQSVLAAFRGHEEEKALWSQILATVTAALDQSTTSVVAAVEKQKGEVLKREQDAYERATTAISKARTDLNLDGKPATVDQTLVTALRGPIAAYQAEAVVQGVTPSPGYADKLQRLKNDAVTQVQAAHDANYAVHTNTRQALKVKPVPAASAKIEERIRSNYNTDQFRDYDLSTRFPQYFSKDNRGYLLSVNSHFHGSGSASGTFNLGFGAGRHMVSTGGARGKKYNYHEVFYDHGNTKLEVKLYIGGFSGGKDTNFAEMDDVTMSITCNALTLPENAVFKQDYVKGTTLPVF